MAAGAHTQEWNGPSRRRVERYELKAPLDVMVLRSGIPDTVPGRTVNVCERGIAAMMAGELTPGETVAIEVQLPLRAEPLRTRALVKYQDKLRCGLEFVGLSAEQQEAIRDCAKTAKAEVTVSSKFADGKTAKGSKTGKTEHGGGEPRSPATEGTGKKRGEVKGGVLVALVIVLVAGGGVFWWRWNRTWAELETGLKDEQTVAAEKPQAQVPAEVMEKLIIHRVEPVYPAEARKANIQGVIALDIVIGRDGTVASMRALNGPDVLARAAMDALRWWKFEPYRLNGEPAVVETTVAVEFKR